MTNRDKLDEMARVARAYAKAIRKTDSVEFVNHQCIDMATQWLRKDCTDLILLGIKNTDQIPYSVLSTLKQIPRVVWMTVDKMAAHGRAIDTSLMNPLTGQAMTGSSSGSAVNILNGIIDAAIATDGGGSILGPALSTGLVGINGKGLDLHGKDVSVSTDGFEFSAGIGTIARNFDIAFLLLEALVGNSLSLSSTSGDNPMMNLNVAISTNALDRIPEHVRKLFRHIVPFDIQEGVERNKGIELLKRLFEQEIHVVISYEGPIDRNGLGDSILGGEGQRRSGKYLLKCGNIVNATSVAIPSQEPGCGFVVQSPKGLEQGKLALYVAQQLAKQVKSSPMYQEYFRKMAFDTQNGFLG